MFKNLRLTIFLCFSVLIGCFFTTTAQNCTCTEMIYLNETTGDGSVHKYSIDPTDGSLTEVLTNGGSWYPGAGVSELPNPHGLTVDVNGVVYIGENTGGDVRQLDCKGNITPVAQYEIDRGGFNFISIGNTLYVNPGNSTSIEAYDLCTQQLINELCLNGLAASAEIDWGLTLAPDGNIYASAGYGNNYSGAKVWRVSPADFGSGNCVDPFLEEDPNGASPSVGDTFLPTNELRGIVFDNNGFMYIVERSLTDNSARILKYDQNGQFVAATPFDTVAGDGGYIQAQGIIFSETTGLLYVSTINPTDDCISIIDPVTMTYLGVGVPSPGDGSRAKGIAITTECCPTNNLQTIDENICLDSNNLDPVNLNDLYNCEGIVCEGIWELQNIDPGIIYEACSQSVTPGNSGCATFTKASDGVGGLCAAFQITLNVCFAIEPTAPEIAVTDNDCDAGTDGVFTISTPCAAGSSIEWSINGGTTWTTTQPVYDATNAVTVRARCLNDTDVSCFSAETVDLVSSPEICDACPPVNCINQLGQFTITKRRP